MYLIKSRVPCHPYGCSVMLVILYPGYCAAKHKLEQRKNVTKTNIVLYIASKSDNIFSVVYLN